MSEPITFKRGEEKASFYLMFMRPVVAGGSGSTSGFSFTNYEDRQFFEQATLADLAALFDQHPELLSDVGLVRKPEYDNALEMVRRLQNQIDVKPLIPTWTTGGVRRE